MRRHTRKALELGLLSGQCVWACACMLLSLAAETLLECTLTYDRTRVLAAQHNKTPAATDARAPGCSPTPARALEPRLDLPAHAGLRLRRLRQDHPGQRLVRAARR